MVMRRITKKHLGEPYHTGFTDHTLTRVSPKRTKISNEEKHMTKRLVGAAFVYAAAVIGALAEQPILSSECSMREVQAITVIEDHGESGDIASEKLGEAGLKLLNARMTCYQGRVSEALALYDEILRLGPVIARRSQ
jgi:hypothetical protein